MGSRNTKKDDNGASKQAAMPVHIANAIRGHAFYQLARLNDSPRRRLKLYKDAKSCGHIVPVTEELESLRQAYQELGWDDSYDPPTISGYHWCEQASLLGCARSTRIIAEIMLRGIFPTLPREAAISYFEEALVLGDKSAADRLGFLYENGITVDRDDQLAAVYYREYTDYLLSLCHGDASNQRVLLLNIGDRAFDDIGFDFKYPDEPWISARTWWLKAAGASNPYAGKIDPQELPVAEALDDISAAALERLGRLAFWGLSVPQSSATACNLWKRAAERSPQARSHLWTLIQERTKFSPKRRSRLRQILYSLPHPQMNSETAWQRSQENDPLRREDRLRQYSEAADAGHLIGLAAHAICLALFDTAVMDTRKVMQLFDQVYARGFHCAPSLARLLRSESLLNEARHGFFRLIRALNDNRTGEESNIPFVAEWSVSADLRKEFYAALKAGKLCIDRSMHLGLDLRTYLSQLVDEPSAAFWKEINLSVQLHSPLLHKICNGDDSPITVKKLASMSDEISGSTSDVGPILNSLDAQGFPILQERASDKRNWFSKRRELGWDRIDRVRISETGFEVVEAVPTPRGLRSLINLSDVEVALILALVEVHQGGEEIEAPSFSLEPFESDSDVAWLLLEKKFYSPEWVGATQFGKSSYYADQMLFIGPNGENFFSLTTPTSTIASVGNKWHQPEPWRRARNGGGVRASHMSRNATVVGHRVEESIEVAENQTGIGFEVQLPTPLAHIDGSEFVFDQEERQLNRDGGRNMLHFWAVRHAAILSESVPQICRAMPVFERYIMLCGLYSTFREALNGRRDAFSGTPLYKQLSDRRKQYEQAWKNHNKSPYSKLAIWH